MKLLITGGSGFIGCNFIHYWLINHPGDSIVNLDKLTYAGNPESLRDIETDPRYRFIKGDIVDVKTVEEAMQNVDWVVHFAAESHVDRSIHDPATFIKTNIIGTQILLETALKFPVKRFHHISTDEVFGSLDVGSKKKFTESTPYNPRSPYAASKASSDHLVRSYGYTFGLPFTISNCSNNFGPYQHPEKLIPLAITNLIEGKKIPLYGDGLNIRDWLYVEDHCRAIDRILSDGKIGETYCIGGMTEDVTNSDVLKQILGLLHKTESDIIYVKDRKGHDRRYAMDWAKINKELSWKPLHPFNVWLEKTVKWYSSHESWWKPLKSGLFETYYRKQYPEL